MLPKKLNKKLEERTAANAFRKLGGYSKLVDFSSNDYLGFAKSKAIFKNTTTYLESENLLQNGATGSRLLSGNHKLYDKLEKTLCEFHSSEAALVYNSGYDANIGFFLAVPQRGDVILYDEFSHASIRDGIQLSNAKAYKFKHNDLEDLNEMLKRTSTALSVTAQSDKNEIYIVTESVFSMDGDSPGIEALSELAQKYKAHLIIDEAHAVGVFGQGLVTIPVFARIVTFGKALGCHGAAILCSKDLKDYLVNFSRSLIYTTALSPHAVATIQCAYEYLIENKNTVSSSAVEKAEDSHLSLRNNINHFNAEVNRFQLQTQFIASHSAIHCCIISGNENVKNLASQLKAQGFDVKPILSPTVPSGKERLRFCLHTYNSKQDITQVLELLATFVV